MPGKASQQKQFACTAHCRHAPQVSAGIRTFMERLALSGSMPLLNRRQQQWRFAPPLAHLDSPWPQPSVVYTLRSKCCQGRRRQGNRPQIHLPQQSPLPPRAHPATAAPARAPCVGIVCEALYWAPDTARASIVGRMYLQPCARATRPWRFRQCARNQVSKGLHCSVR